MKLHLGCGPKHIEGYVNVDVRYQPGVDSIDNVIYLRRYKSNSIDEIYASHVLEHLGRWNYKSALRRWYDILKPEGVAKICVPNFKAMVAHYTETGDLNSIRGLMYGGQDFPNNIHTWCWDFNELSKDLIKVGFKTVDVYDWKLTNHADIDDYSQCYLPHMDKENGKLMSLNVKAIK